MIKAAPRFWLTKTSILVAFLALTGCGQDQDEPTSQENTAGPDQAAAAVAAEKPEGVPKQNWLPMARGDYGVDLSMRIYAPDLERFKFWDMPRAEVVE